MDNTINRCIIFGEHPPRGVYFTVLVEYNTENPMLKGEMSPGSMLISSPLPSFNDALEASDKIMSQLKEKFESADVVEVDPDAHNGFHLYLHDAEETMLARVGVEVHDNRHETFH